MCVRFLFSKFGVLILFLILEHVLILLLFVHNNSVTIKPDVIKHYKRLLEKLYYDDKEPPTVYQSRVNSTWLSNHPVYGKFYIRERKVKRIVDILVIVSSAPRRIERRNAIRATWFTQCVTTKKIVPACIFMTDYQSPDDDYHDTLEKEKKTFKDIYLQLVGGGVTFGKRFLSHMVFAMKKYDFKYFLRMDDDIFFCFNRFLHELPNPMSKQFHWGWVHGGETPRAEESIFLISRDVHERFLLQDPLRMLCHPLADQMIGVWLKEMNITRLLNHDVRIHHHPPVKLVPQLRKVKGICSNFIALHGTYPTHMRIFWKNRGEQDASLYTNLTAHVIHVTLKKHFDWRKIDPAYTFKPKLCIRNPKWDTSEITTATFFAGRESMIAQSEGGDRGDEVADVFHDAFAERTIASSDLSFPEISTGFGGSEEAASEGSDEVARDVVSALEEVERRTGGTNAQGVDIVSALEEEERRTAGPNAEGAQHQMGKDWEEDNDDNQADEASEDEAEETEDEDADADQSEETIADQTGAKETDSDQNAVTALDEDGETNADQNKDTATDQDGKTDAHQSEETNSLQNEETDSHRNRETVAKQNEVTAADRKGKLLLSKMK